MGVVEWCVRVSVRVGGVGECESVEGVCVERLWCAWCVRVSEW